MKADAVAVRWSDEANQRYPMLASDCFPQDMVDEERSLLAPAPAATSSPMPAPASFPSTATKPRPCSAVRGWAPEL